MLILNRKPEESLVIGDNIIIRILDTRDGYTRLGVTAPGEIQVHRSEVYERIHGQLPEISSRMDAATADQLDT